MCRKGYFASYFLTTILVIYAVADSSLGLESNWNIYLRTKSDYQPRIEFPFYDCFERSALANDLPVTLLLAVARGESNFEPTAVSKKNAVGVMQILWPGTAQDLGFRHRSELFDACNNIEAGARYLNFLLDKYNGNVHRAVAAYNYGPGRIAIKGAIPSGAQWYSQYIYDHLQYVLAESVARKLEQFEGRYSDRKTHILTVSRSIAVADGFKRYLAKKFPHSHFDVFRTPLGHLQVILLYKDVKELNRVLSLI